MASVSYSCGNDRPPAPEAKALTQHHFRGRERHHPRACVSSPGLLSASFSAAGAEDLWPQNSCSLVLSAASPKLSGCSFLFLTGAASNLLSLSTASLSNLSMQCILFQLEQNER